MISNGKLNDITDPLKIYMYAQKLCDPATSVETTRHAYPTLQEAIGCAQKIEREFLIVKEI